MLKILMKFDNEVLKTFQIEKSKVTIGRNADNDIQIDNLAVSAYHARIMEHRGHILIEDLTSTNGTFVNEKRIAKGALKDNDAVTIGKHTLVVHTGKGTRKSSRRNTAEVDPTMELETKRHKKMLRRKKEIGVHNHG
jgi:pSer/pThr/pTyr-binding forkhead associated (FHA) protein